MPECGDRRHQTAFGKHGGKFALGFRRLANFGQQYAAFFPGLADGRNAKGCVGVAAAECLVSRFHAPTGKYQGARREINLAVAHHHENFHAAPSITQQHDRGSRAGGGGCGVTHARIAARPGRYRKVPRFRISPNGANAGPPRGSPPLQCRGSPAPAFPQGWSAVPRPPQRRR